MPFVKNTTKYNKSFRNLNCQTIMCIYKINPVWSLTRSNNRTFTVIKCLSEWRNSATKNIVNHTFYMLSNTVYNSISITIESVIHIISLLSNVTPKSILLANS